MNKYFQIFFGLLEKQITQSAANIRNLIFETCREKPSLLEITSKDENKILLAELPK